MKRVGFFAAVAALIVFVVGIFFLDFQRSRVQSGPPVDLQTSVENLKTRFLNQTKPLQQLNLQEMIASRISSELRDPSQTLPHSEFPQPELQRLVQYAENCVLPARPWNFTTLELRKAFIWQQFQCHQLRSLPSTFFETGPWMHPNGKSYAWLQKSENHEGTEWIKSHAHSFHLLEILNDPEIAGYKLGLLPGELQSLLESASFLITAQGVYLNLVNQNDQTARKPWQIFSRPEWETFSNKEPWVASLDLQSSACVLIEANTCWIANLNYRKSWRDLSLQLLSGLFALLLVGLLIIGWRRWKFERHLQAQRLFVVQMLTHELRTPATSLTLGLETFRQDFDQLPESSQKSFLRISEEVQRLNRVIEASQDYLRADVNRPATAKTATSLNDLLQAICENIPAVNFTPLISNPQTPVHRRWLELCVKNLVENSLKHGKPPILVSLSESSRFYTISVQDQGVPSFKSLQEMSQPFQKGPNSSGLGLGLTVIQKVLERMDANLEFENTPTTFKIHLRKPV